MIENLILKPILKFKISKNLFLEPSDPHEHDGGCDFHQACNTCTTFQTTESAGVINVEAWYHYAPELNNRHMQNFSNIDLGIDGFFTFCYPDDQLSFMAVSSERVHDIFKQI